ncbi:hypothetical protein GPALN_010883 [Globodera pallida]|nr:hypothetical protein GPALN_010883 [Globodera pallida]
MIRSHKSNQKLLDYLFFVVLLNLTQTVLRTECQKDLIKNGQELLLSSAASSVFNEMNSGSIDVDKLTELEHKYAFDILCGEKIEIKMDKKLLNALCQQIKTAKNIDKAEGNNVQKMALIWMKPLVSKPNKFNEIKKMAENHLLNAKNKAKMAKIVELFIQGIGKCYEILKAHKNGLMQRRQKRMAFDIERGTTTQRNGENKSCIGHLAKALISAALAPCFAIDGFIRSHNLSFTALFVSSTLTFLHSMFKFVICLCMCLV